MVSRAREVQARLVNEIVSSGSGVTSPLFAWNGQGRIVRGFQKEF